MEILLGITGKDFTLIATSKAAMRGATILKGSDDKTRKLSEHTLLAFSGEAGDTVQFAEFIQANTSLYTIRNGTPLQPKPTASFIRNELATSLRTRDAYSVNLLMGGCDTRTSKPSLYWIDYLASMAEVPYAAHGYAQYYCLSLLDKHHDPSIDLEKGMKILKLCSDELRRRLPVDFKGLQVQVVDQKGVRNVEFDESNLVIVP